MVTEQEWKLLEKRYEAMPENLGVACIRYGSLTKKEILKHIKAEDEIGEDLLRVSMHYLKKLKTGLI